MFKAIKNLLILVITTLTLAILLFGYLGYVPVLRTWFGSDKPKDLGVLPEEEDFATIARKTGVIQKTLLPTLDPKESIAFEGSKEIKAEFRSGELTAMALLCRWKYCPYALPQVLVSNDGTVEVSGVLRTSRIDGFLRAFDLPTDDVRKALRALRVDGFDPPFYLKGRASMQGGDLRLEIDRVEVGRMPLPKGLVAKHAPAAEALLESVMAKVPGLTVRSASFEGGVLVFDGTYPAVESFVRE